MTPPSASEGTTSESVLVVHNDDTYYALLHISKWSWVLLAPISALKHTPVVHVPLLLPLKLQRWTLGSLMPLPCTVILPPLELGIDSLLILVKILLVSKCSLIGVLHVRQLLPKHRVLDISIPSQTSKLKRLH